MSINFVAVSIDASPSLIRAFLFTRELLHSHRSITSRSIKFHTRREREFPQETQLCWAFSSFKRISFSSFLLSVGEFLRIFEITSTPSSSIAFLSLSLTHHEWASEFFTVGNFILDFMISHSQHTARATHFLFRDSLTRADKTKAQDSQLISDTICVCRLLRDLSSCLTTQHWAYYLFSQFITIIVLMEIRNFTRVFGKSHEWVNRI